MSHTDAAATTWWPIAADSSGRSARQAVVALQRVDDGGAAGGVLRVGDDPVAVQVARDNARINGERPFIRAATADGLVHPAIRGRAPFDLIVANILAGPLTYLAPSLAAALAPGGVAVLSGLLRNQEQLVLSFYRSQGLVFRKALRDGPWSALVLERP